jgi:hypothetical protein
VSRHACWRNWRHGDGTGGSVEHVPLARAELAITAEWRRRDYTTDPPRYIPFRVWSLDFGITCEVPIRVVRLLTFGDVVRWGMDGGQERAARRSLTATFHPKDWLHSDEVHVVFGSAVWVDDANLKADPRPLVQVQNPEAVTGEVVTLAAALDLGIRFGILAFAHEDTEDRRLSKWRVAPRHKEQLPRHLRDLTSGYQSGEVLR